MPRSHFVENAVSRIVAWKVHQEELAVVVHETLNTGRWTTDGVSALFVGLGGWSPLDETNHQSGVVED